MACLEVIRTPPQRMPLSVPVLKDVTVIGRQGTSDIELKWDGISRVHSRILGSQPDGSGIFSRWRIVDEGGGSNNGTFVNGERIQEKELQDGDIIGYGRGRSVPIGGYIADRNLEYIFLWKVVVTTPPVVRGKIANNLADAGVHRHLRGASRHPLGGHAVSGAQKEKKQAIAELPAGQIIPPSKSMVYPPSNFVPSKSDKQPPPSELVLEYCYGYRGHDVSDSVHYLDASTIVYPAGAMVVRHDLATNTQSFFLDHDDDVVCLAVDPSKKFVASGQIASRQRRDAESNRPSATVLVWDARTMRRNIDRPPPHGSGWTSRGVLSRTHLHRIQALDFDPSSKYLVTFGGDLNNASAICVYDWRKGSIWFKCPAGCSNVPVVKHNPFTPHMYSFVQCGDRNLRMWDYAKAQTSPEQAFTNASMLRYTGGKPCGVNCVAFLPDGQTCVAAMETGALFFFGPKGPEMTVLDSVPNGRGGALAHQGQVLYVLCDGRFGVVSSGEDGFVRVWAFEWRDGRFSQDPRLIKQVSVRAYAPRGFEKACAVASMDHLNGKLLCGTTANSILEIDLAAMEQTGHDTKHASVRVLHVGHCGQSLKDKRLKVLLPSLAVTSVATFKAPSEHLFATVGSDCTLRVWHSGQRRIQRLQGGKDAIAAMGMDGSCIDVSDDGCLIAVGHSSGDFTLWDANTLKCVLQNNFRRSPISVVRFSPGCKYLAVGSGGRSIDVYNVSDPSYRRVGQDESRHTAGVWHLDWSRDGEYIRSTDNSATLMYWYAPSLKPFTDHSSFFRDTRWSTESCTLGWDRKHIHQGGVFNNVNAVDVSAKKHSLACVDDDGMVTLYKYPAIVEDAPFKVYHGHCSSVVDVRFTADDRFLMTVGSSDLCVLQWRHIVGKNHALNEGFKRGGIAMRANDG